MDDIENVERKNRYNLIALCMKETFEKSVYEKMSTDISLPDLDAWLDPEIRRYFVELDAVNRFYDPEFFENGVELSMTNDQIKGEKSGIINYCLQIEMKKEAVKILNSAKTLEEADEKLKRVVSKTKLAGLTICSFYGIEDQEEAE